MADLAPHRARPGVGRVAGLRAGQLRRRRRSSSALGRSRTRLGGLASAVGRPCSSAMPAISAGSPRAVASDPAGSAIGLDAGQCGERPAPSPGRAMPGGAWSNGASLASGRVGRGRWRWRRWCRRPARPSPRRRRRRPRSGGLTLNTGSHEAHLGVGRAVRWCGVASARDRRRPPALASAHQRRPSRPWTCAGSGCVAPVRRARAMSQAHHQLLGRRAAGRRCRAGDDHSPSCMWPPAARALVLAVLGQDDGPGRPLAYSMARRISRSSCTPLPSSVNSRTPRAAISAMGDGPRPRAARR